MSYSKADQRRERALARLTSRIAKNLETGRAVTFSERREFEALLSRLGQARSPYANITEASRVLRRLLSVKTSYDER